MHVHHGPARVLTPPAIEAARLDRRGFLRRTALRLAAPAALALAGLPTDRAAAQSAEGAPVTPPAATESGYAPVNGLELYYEIHGTASSGRPPLVLLHGGLGTIGFEFDRLLPALAQSRQVIAAELQGHGHTADVDRPLRFEAMAADVAALTAHLGHERVDVFGYSLGGGVALQLAVRHPAAVRKLVVASAPFRRDGWYPEVVAGMSQMNAEAAAAMVGTPFHAAYVSAAPRPEDWPTLVAKLGQLLAQDYDWSTSVATISAPTLIAVGDSDSVRPEHAVEMFRLLGGGVPGDFVGLPKSQLAVLPGTGHGIPPTGLPSRADLLIPIVAPFLEAPTPESR